MVDESGKRVSLRESLPPPLQQVYEIALAHLPRVGPGWAGVDGAGCGSATKRHLTCSGLISPVNGAVRRRTQPQRDALFA